MRREGGCGWRDEELRPSSTAMDASEMGELSESVERSPSACMFNVLQSGASGILERRSRGEAFRSAEARPLATDWPLRAGLKGLLRLEALTFYHKLPRGPAK